MLFLLLLTFSLLSYRDRAKQCFCLVFVVCFVLFLLILVVLVVVLVLLGVVLVKIAVVASRYCHWDLNNHPEEHQNQHQNHTNKKIQKQLFIFSKKMVKLRIFLSLCCAKNTLKFINFHFWTLWIYRYFDWFFPLFSKKKHFMTFFLENYWFLCRLPAQY